MENHNCRRPYAVWYVWLKRPLVLRSVAGTVTRRHSEIKAREGGEQRAFTLVLGRQEFKGKLSIQLSLVKKRKEVKGCRRLWGLTRWACEEKKLGTKG